MSREVSLEAAFDANRWHVQVLRFHFLIVPSHFALDALVTRAIMCVKPVSGLAAVSTASLTGHSVEQDTPAAVLHNSAHLW